MDNVRVENQVTCCNCEGPVEPKDVRNDGNEVELCHHCQDFCCHECGAEIDILDAAAELSDAEDNRLCGDCYEQYLEEGDDEDWEYDDEDDWFDEDDEDYD